MRRFLRVYRSLMRFSLSKTMEFRFDFFFRFIMDCAYYAVSIGFFELLFLHTETLAGWSQAQVRIFITGSLLLDALYMTAIARNVWELPTIINRGELDFYLTRPFPSLVVLLLRSFEWSSVMNVVVSAALMTYAFVHYPEPLATLQVMGFFVLLANGFVLLTCVRLFSVLPVFWTQSQFGFHMLFQALDQVADRPDVIFRGIMRVLFLTVVPLFVVTSFPPRFLFGGLSVAELIYALLLTLAFIGLTVWVWNRGLKIYSSASS